MTILLSIDNMIIIYLEITLWKGRPFMVFNRSLYVARLSDLSVYHEALRESVHKIINTVSPYSTNHLYYDN